MNQRGRSRGGHTGRNSRVPPNGAQRGQSGQQDQEDSPLTLEQFETMLALFPAPPTHGRPHPRPMGAAAGGGGGRANNNNNNGASTTTTSAPIPIPDPRRSQANHNQHHQQRLGSPITFDRPRPVDTPGMAAEMLARFLALAERRRRRAIAPRPGITAAQEAARNLVFAGILQWRWEVRPGTPEGETNPAREEESEEEEDYDDDDDDEAAAPIRRY